MLRRVHHGVHASCHNAPADPAHLPTKHMIVCHRHRFIFITTRKTAGARIESALAQFCDDGDIVSGATAANGLIQARSANAGNGSLAQARYRPMGWLRILVRGKRARLDKHLSAVEIRDLLDPEI
jgi:hypothetical protein